LKHSRQLLNEKETNMRRRRPFKHSSFTVHVLRLSAFCLLLFAFCLRPSAYGQSATATLSGTIEDQNGAVIPGATVTAVNTATTLERRTTTNSSGNYTIPLLPPGTYVVRVEVQGFAPVRVDNVVLNVGDQKALTIPLKAGNISEMVKITADAPLVNESPAVGTVVDRQFVANIPLNGRSFQSLITLTPGVQVVPSGADRGQFSVNGQRPSANSFTVDGVSANFGTAVFFFPGAQTGGDLPGLTTFGTTQSLVSVDAMEEFRVQTSGSTAEYGRQPGGQISIVTRSGTNQFHGSLFDYLRNDVFDANDWFGNANRQRRPPERQNDFGGTFSGPVLLPRFGEGGRQPGYNGRNRTFFFFSYEGLRLRQPKFGLNNVPTLALRQTAPAGMQPILNAFPLPNGRDLGNGMAEFTAAYSDASSLDATSVRIDHTFNSRWTLFGRYNRAPSETITRNASLNLSQLNSSRLNTQTVTLGLTASLTPHVSNDLRMNFSDNHGTGSLTLDNFAGATPVPWDVVIPSQYDSTTAQGNVQLLFPGRTSIGSLVDILRKHFYSQSQFNIVDSFSLTVGAHQLRLGVDYRRVTPVNAFNAYLMVATFNSSQDVLNSRSSTGSIQTFTGFRPVYSNFSAFAQDTWKVSRRFTLDFGLRWEVNPAPGEANGNVPLAVTAIDNLSTMQLAPRGTSLWKTTYNNFAPRLGVAYQLSQNPGNETVVRGGFGVYYDTGNEFGSIGFTQFPFTATRSLSITFPLSPAQVAPPSLPSLTPPYGTLTTFDPALKLPYTLEWNVALQRSIGQSQAVTVSYVGAAGRRLLQQRRLNLGPSINPNFTVVFLTTNKATSDYHAFQAQFQRRLSRGLQALASYTWSHAIDEDSAGNTLRLPKRGNANFDVRHNFAAAVTYDIPSPKVNRVSDAVLSHWSVDTTIHAQSALPVDLVASTLVDPATGTVINVRPDVIAGVPLYIEGSTLPGGRQINRAAFSIPLAGQSGTLGRNVLRGLPAWQVDLALRRQISLTEKLRLQLRGEAFNLFNHPNFGTMQTSLTAANFGQATNMLNRQLGGLSQLYQIGGPRSMQFALKLIF
jgi:Carboxypeptidase regulatory-like domain/TonB dependent receptor/TonB-dependent Receptor Plug Domain